MTAISIKRDTNELGESGPEGLRSRKLSAGMLQTDRCGRFILGTEAEFLSRENVPLGGAGQLSALAGTYLQERRRIVPDEMDYLILVPTLRCNLACSYCQVSRASLRAEGYDWDAATLAAVVELVSNLKASAVKIEFQGGEPTLRPDLIMAVIDAVPSSVDVEYVICTNLQEISEKTLTIFDRGDVSISTSLDGPLDVHSRQRGDATSSFWENLEFLIDRYGPEKISALPTVDPLSPPDPEALAQAFGGYGMHSIYLRPINFQGFARKNHAASRENGEAWSDYHRKFIKHLIDRNWENKEVVFEESYFSLILRRIFRPGADRHVDLRNPNPLGRDYIVIDYDGTAYPTDEARMLTRSGVVDLSIGDVFTGWDTPERDALDAASTLDGDPVCESCVYKPYCGRDLVDDISRYGTVDLQRADTEFCRRHMALFDHAFEAIYSRDDKVRYSLGKWMGLPGPMPTMDIGS